ncbi:hypothetical protein PZN02_005844 (plasmid) [Sinorhizobium garamanticum]|uniref:Uncharacterized protein n=1 Tax=Sinorhizobium garamanticum TaxID=680247 RepID=A0ABY8DL05_9HYPH|nr:hypothetical protein [Sinorhizobium garamanticum]WEX91589.1 hypothetical protein PZN02_005844 [Sinorhizobium garamanticum]
MNDPLGKPFRKLEEGRRVTEILVDALQKLLVEASIAHLSVSKCRRILHLAGAPSAICPYCHTDYEQEGEEILVEDFYPLEGLNSRDIGRMIVIHGMNSRAKGQEEFSWQIANRLRYSAPVLIYKYGWVAIDVQVKWLHRRLEQNPITLHHSPRRRSSWRIPLV